MSEVFHRKILPPIDIVANDIIKVGKKFYKVNKTEPIYYEFRNTLPDGTDIGFAEQTYTIPRLVPPIDYINYIMQIGIAGLLKVCFYIPLGQPRFLPEGVAEIKLDWVVASYTDPYPLRFTIVQGDNIVVSIKPINENDAYGAIWFFGYKLNVAESGPMPSFKTLEDVRGS